MLTALDDYWLVVVGKLRKSRRRWAQMLRIQGREGAVEPSPGYSVLCRIPEGDTSKTTIFDQEMSYVQTVKLPYISHNLAH